jgi:23S rRNA pseudouridine1911/1915/1917 synthase
MEERVRCHWQATSGKTHRIYVGVPHRLDRPVSGALIFTRNRRASGRVAQQFALQQIEKTYLALIEGMPEQLEGTWQDYLAKDPQRAHVRVVTASQPDALLAILSYQVLAIRKQETLVAVQLHTGRTHQIRVQFASRGYPVLGDFQYGSQRNFDHSITDPRRSAVALHARRIRFRHPTRPYFVTVTAPVPAAWNELIPGVEQWIFDQERKI